MRDFFASLRRLLAYVNLERMRLGTIVQQFITDEIIPQLRKRLDGVRTDTDREYLTRLIAEYEKYADPSQPESRIFDKTAANIVRTLASRSHFNDESMEDLMQKLAVDFFQSRGAAGDLRDQMRRAFKTIDGGPLTLNKLWMSIVDVRVRFFIRETLRHQKEEEMAPRENDEGEALDPMGQVADPNTSLVDEGAVRAVMKDLVGYIHSKVKNPKFVEIFDRWFELAQEKGADRVDMKHDVYMPMVDDGLVTTYSTFNEQWIGIKRLIVQFFEHELGEQVSRQVRKIMHVGMAEVLAYEEYRRRLAAWMLGGILRGMIASEDQG